MLGVTGPDGTFELELPAGHNYQCLQAGRLGFLAGQAPLPQTNLGVTTLPAGDVTNNGVIDIFDLALVGNRYGQSHPLADINADGLVDIFDLALAAANYRRSGPVTLGPEAGLH